MFLSQKKGARERERNDQNNIPAFYNSLYASNTFYNNFNRTRTTRTSRDDLEKRLGGSLEGEKERERDKRQRRERKREFLSFSFANALGGKEEGTIRYSDNPPFASPTFCFMFSRERERQWQRDLKSKKNGIKKRHKKS